jgi:hypothetical protein
MTGQRDPFRDRPTPVQLLVYGFAPGAEFEGRLVGAIERRGRGEGSLVAPCSASGSTRANGAG